MHFPLRPTTLVATLIALGSPLATGSQPVKSPPPQAHAHSPHCASADAEAKLRKREDDLIGARHAEQHARMRSHQCEVQRGVRAVPARGRVTPAAKTLEQDAAVRQAAAQRIAPHRGARIDQAVMAAADTASTQGLWSEPFIIPVVGVTAVLLHTGKVMFWSYDPVDYHNPANSRNGVGYIWNPATRVGYNIPPPENIWCSAQTILADGRVFVAGGNLRYPDPKAPAGTGSWAGTITSYTFNPATELWARQPDMARGRWYPTATQLADNRVVITSGIDETGSNAITNVVEIFTPAANAQGIGTMQAVGLHNPSGLYPLQFLLPSGSVLEAGPAAASSFLFDPQSTQWTQLPAMRGPHDYLGNGISYTDASAAVMKQVVMVAGGHDERNPLAGNEWLDGSNPAAGWRPYPLWQTARHNANTVILPDGKLLTAGGNRGLYGYENPLLDTEMYSAQASATDGTWLKMAPHAIQAAYHSTAILLPDATVLLSQDDMDFSAAAAFQHKAQVYSPPYLFRGPQPRIVSAPDVLVRGETFSVVTDRANMASAVLVAPGATTHGNDMHQRAIRLAVQPLQTGLAATLPKSAAVVPPGHYMLFVMDGDGIPSVAKFVRVG